MQQTLGLWKYTLFEYLALILSSMATELCLEKSSGAI